MPAGQLFSLTVLEYFGLASQTLAVLLLLVLFSLLRRHAGRRAYFRVWGGAWVALAAALVVLVLCYEVLSRWFGSGGERAGWVLVCYFIYQFGKLAFVLLLLRGTLLYIYGDRGGGGGRWRLLWIAALAVAVLSVAATPDLQALMFWQGLCNLAVYGLCAYLLLRLPAARAGLGTRVTGLVLLATLIQWVLYVMALAHLALPNVKFGLEMFALLTDRNTYLDLILEMLLAFGMVLVLFEDGRRELDSINNELRIAHEQLQREALIDSLTLVYNRRAFNEGVGLEEAHAGFGALVVFDLDNLKDVNDAHGHACGDELLKHFVTALRAGLRPSDRIYRLGGDEFLVVVPCAGALVVGPRLQKLIAAAPPLEWAEGAVRIPVQASIGAADFAGIEDLESALVKADHAMYQHKRASKSESHPLTGVGVLDPES